MYFLSLDKNNFILSASETNFLIEGCQISKEMYDNLPQNIYSYEKPIYKYEKGKIIKDVSLIDIKIVKQSLITKVKEEACRKLSQSDWEIIKYRDLRELNILKKTQDDKYIVLLKERQSIRDKSNSLEDEINKISNIEDLMNFSIKF